MPRAIPVKPQSIEALIQAASPENNPRGNSEAYHIPFFDTQTYAAAGTTTQLRYFQNPQADRTLSNMEAPGSFPDPKFFQLWNISCDVILPVQSAAVPQAWADMQNIVMVGRPILSLIISDKEYGPVPLSFCHASGGVTGFGYSVAAVAATSAEYANNGSFDGGFWMDGAILIPPKVGFSVRIEWGNPQAVLADTLIRVNLDGVIYRRIL